VVLAPAGRGGAGLAQLAGSLITLIRKPEERDWLVHLILTSKSAVRPFVHALLALVLLPYDALICLDAIVRSGVRMLFTRRGLLLWQLQSYSIRNARRSLADFSGRCGLRLFWRACWPWF